MKQMKLWFLGFALLMLGYGVYLMMYLKNKNMAGMSQKDQNSKNTAVVIVGLQIGFSVIAVLSLLFSMMTGDNNAVSPLPSNMAWF